MHTMRECKLERFDFSPGIASIQHNFEQAMQRFDTSFFVRHWRWTY